MNSAWHYQSATYLVNALRQGDISSRSLLECYIARVQSKNAEVNAVIAQNLEAARARADAADLAISKGVPWGALHGLPMTIKDAFEVQGMPCVAGAPSLRNYYPAASAAAVQRLTDAGAIIFGKTNVPLFSSDLQTHNKVHGITRNPHNLAFTPGGSSGGAAAALAAGFTAVELGSDIGGSIRVPAHFCGVYGHKPTHGMISLRGHIPGQPGNLAEPDLNVAGPMARCAEDLALMLDVLTGPSPTSQPGWQLTLPPARQHTLADYRVLMWMDDPLCPIDQRMQSLYTQLQATLQRCSVKVKTGAPLNLQLRDIYPTYLNLLASAPQGAARSSGHQALGFVAALLGRAGKYVGLPAPIQSFAAGLSQSHCRWMEVTEQRLRLTEAFGAIFDHYDVILMPPTASTAFRHLLQPLPLRRLKINGTQRAYTDLIPWLAPATLYGLPATSAPIGCTREGLPVNVQIMAAPWQDKATIRFAELLSRVMGGFRAPAGY